MIVIAIIGILAAIAIPVYKNYMVKTVTSACLSEVKGYSNDVFYTINEQTYSENNHPQKPVLNHCLSITDASGWTAKDNDKVIYAVAKSPSNAKIRCDIPKGVPCDVIK